MLRIRTISYLRHLHVIVHSAQNRLRFPVYLIQQGEPHLDNVQSLNGIEEDAFEVYSTKDSFYRKYCLPLSLLALAIVTAILLLSLLLASSIEYTIVDQCPIYDCLWINATTHITSTDAENSSQTISSSNYISTISLIVSSTTTTANVSVTIASTITTTATTGAPLTTQTPLQKDLLYGENCTEHEECQLAKHLFCELEFDPVQKHCYCETTYFWNEDTQECEPKHEKNEPCKYDGECRLDQGITCELVPEATSRICTCMGTYFWAKISNCGELKVQAFVDCTDEPYITVCLVSDLEGDYHAVNIRQVQGDDIKFDYFLVDSPTFKEVERIECASTNNKRYCFGIQSDTNQLLITTIGIDGIRTFNNISEPVIGLPNVLTQPDGTIVCYVEGSDSNLISITMDPKVNDTIRVHERGGETYGDRSCFVAVTKTSYCFYRNIDHRLTVVVMNGTTVTEDVQLNVNLDNNLKTGPSCGWVGHVALIKLYCFAIFNEEQIYRIEQSNSKWTEWKSMQSETIFIQRPLFIASEPPLDLSATQSCHVLAIDSSNEVYVSSNSDCAHQDTWTPWLLLQADVGLVSFNGTFRLRDGRIGIFGVGIDDLPYYTTMNPATDLFEPIKLAASTQ